MILIKERIGKLVEDLKNLIYVGEVPITGYRILRSGERFSDIHDLPSDGWEELTNRELWGGHREYFWFKTVVTIPAEFQDKCVVYELKTGREGQWDATNPQFTAYVNGVRRQGLDVNHREVMLTEKAVAGESYQIVLSAFTGDENFKLSRYARRCG